MELEETIKRLEEGIVCPICGQHLHEEEKQGIYTNDPSVHPYSCDDCGISIVIFTDDPNLVFKVGQRVKWYDPGIMDYEPEDRDGAMNRVFLIHDVDNRHGIAYIVEEGGGSEAEVYTDELEPI